ncbi:MAG: NAD(+) synthase [Myxococcota bacterium]|jgi:NAD+ synthase (glutamine-hydrolysing)|nr:NAD(+) synthase [Myxococcota bacterium]
MHAPARLEPLHDQHQAHISVASMNQTVGDWAGNHQRIVELIDTAKARGVRLLLLPEMCISGYSLGDRLQRSGTLSRSWQSLLELRKHTEGIAVAVGLPLLHEGVILNAMGLVANGQLCGLVAKENLATGDVEYENRWFQAWPPGRCETHHGEGEVSVPLGTQLFELPGLGTIGFEICEDAWKGLRPGSVFALCGADILLNPSASWFSIGKHAVRRRMVTQISLEDHCAYLYASLSGCDATRLIFDGASFIAVNGRLEAEGARFVFTQDYHLIDRVIDLTEIRHIRMEEGSWREQHARLQNGTYGPMPVRTLVEGDFSSTRQAPPPPPYWLPAPSSSVDSSLQHIQSLWPRALEGTDLCHLELELALCLALRDYTRKTGIHKLCLALSGGRDSAMVALLVERMLRYQHPQLPEAELRAIVQERFVCAYLATNNSSSTTREAARAVAEGLGARFLDGVIQDPLSTATQAVERMLDTTLSWENPKHDLPLQNIQARMRSVIIWTVANLEHALLLVTSNKSEAAVGYCTMDGDTSGGLAPISDVPKSLISVYLHWARDFHQYNFLDKILVQAATAELRPLADEQTDEADLMPFFILDQLMFAFVQLGLEPLAILQKLWPAVEKHYRTSTPAQPLTRFAADIRKFVRMLCYAQWKRERFAIGFRVTAFDLDPKTGFRFPPVQAPFTEELAEMDAWVAQHEQVTP